MRPMVVGEIPHGKWRPRRQMWLWEAGGRGIPSRISGRSSTFFANCTIILQMHTYPYSQRPPLSRKPAILVGNDNRTFRMYVSVLLNRMSYDVISAESGQDTLRLSRRIDPDVILLDQSMPGTGGQPLLSLLKNDPFTLHIPVIMMMGGGAEGSTEELRSLGCSGFIHKPIDLVEVHEVLTQCFALKGGNKRRHLRTEYTEKVEVRTDGASREHTAKSLSVGGVYLYGEEPLPVGTKVVVDLPLRHRDCTTLKGSVLYNRGVYAKDIEPSAGMAIGFSNVSVREASRLRDFITYSLTRDLPAAIR